MRNRGGRYLGSCAKRDLFYDGIGGCSAGLLFDLRSAQSEVILLINEKSDRTVTEMLNQYGYLNRKNDGGEQ